MAVANDGDAIRYAAGDLQNDLEVACRAVATTSSSIFYLPKSLRANKMVLRSLPTMYGDKCNVVVDDRGYDEEAAKRLIRGVIALNPLLMCYSQNRLMVGVQFKSLFKGSLYLHKKLDTDKKYHTTYQNWVKSGGYILTTQPIEVVHSALQNQPIILPDDCLIYFMTEEWIKVDYY